MPETVCLKLTGPALMATLLLACASTAPLIETPRVSLRSIEVTRVDLGSQTFLLDFDVTNTNPYPLPVRTVTYSVELDGFHFASGEAEGAFTVPAGSDGTFAISVDLDLLETAPALMFIVRNGVYRDIPYKLKGRIEVDIPFAEPVTFETRGVIRFDKAEFSANRRN